MPKETDHISEEEILSAYQQGYDYFPKLGHADDKYPKIIRDAFDQGWQDAVDEAVAATDAKTVFRTLQPSTLSD